MKEFIKKQLKKNDMLYFMLKNLKNKFNDNNEIYFDKKIVDKKLKKFSKIGIEKHTNGEQILISLTSFPARINDVKYTIYSLLNQTYRPDKLILWLGAEQFPKRENELPKDLVRLKQNGLQINFVKDIKSFKKLVPALQQYTNFLIVTVDDDIFYPSTLLENLYQEHIKYPDCIIAHRAHRIKFENGNIAKYSDWEPEIKNEYTTPSYLNFLTGGAGAMYHSSLLHSDVTNEELFMKYCPKADDVWFNAMAVRQGTKIKIANGGSYPLCYINPESEMAGINTLGSYNNGQNGNDKQIQCVLEHYPDVLKRLKDEFYGK